MKLSGYTIGLLLAFCTPVLVGAETVIRGGERVNLEAEQSVSGDFYAFGGVVAASGNVDGDLYALGGSVTLNGEVADDFVALGGIVNVHGPIGEDVRILSGEALIAEHVFGDVVVVGDVLHILSTAEIEGDVFFFGRELEMNGVVRGSITGEADSVRLDGGVSRSVNMTVGKLTLGERAHIDGDVEVVTNASIVRAQGAVVVGDVVQQQRTSASILEDADFTTLLVSLFSVLALLFLFKGQVGEVYRVSTSRYQLHALVGLGILLISPLVIALLLVSIIGMFGGLLLLFAYLALLFLAWVLSGIIFGAHLARYLTKRDRGVQWQWSVLGVVVLHLLLLIPLIGPLVVLGVFVVVLGTLGMIIYGYFR